MKYYVAKKKKWEFNICYEAQAGIKIARRNINNLRYAPLWQKVKMNSKASL